MRNFFAKYTRYICTRYILLMLVTTGYQFLLGQADSHFPIFDTTTQPQTELKQKSEAEWQAEFEHRVAASQEQARYQAERRAKDEEKTQDEVKEAGRLAAEEAKLRIAQDIARERAALKREKELHAPLRETPPPSIPSVEVVATSGSTGATAAAEQARANRQTALAKQYDAQKDELVSEAPNLKAAHFLETAFPYQEVSVDNKRLIFQFLPEEHHNLGDKNKQNKSAQLRADSYVKSGGYKNGYKIEFKDNRFEYDSNKEIITPVAPIRAAPLPTPEALPRQATPRQSGINKADKLTDEGEYEDALQKKYADQKEQKVSTALVTFSDKIDMSKMEVAGNYARIRIGAYDLAFKLIDGAWTIEFTDAVYRYDNQGDIKK